MPRSHRGEALAVDEGVRDVGNRGTPARSLTEVRRDARIPLAVAFLGAGLLVLVWYLAFHAGPAQRFDGNVLDGFTALDRGHIGRLAEIVPHLSDPAPFALAAIILVAIAFVRERPRHALAVIVILAGANLTTQVLKNATFTPRPVNSDALWPSGHATASMSLALCAVLVASTQWRPFVSGLGAAWSLAVTLTLLITAWHLPSDVVGGYVMAATWTSLAVAGLWATEARGPAGAGPERVGLVDALTPAFAVGVVGLAFGLFVVLVRPTEVSSYARDHTSFVIGASLIALLGLTVAALLSVAMTTTRRGGGPAPTAAPRRRWPRARG
jgi:membrane-associated phospholipid phosphatase